jgi:hypothetical protein
VEKSRRPTPLTLLVPSEMRLCWRHGDGIAFHAHGTSARRPPHGFQDACCDPLALRQLWARYPGSLVGVRTGPPSGIDVLDLDRKHRDALQWWNAHRDRIPVTRVHRTRAGGLHLIFQHSPGTRCSANRIALGVDVRADGGYVIWWPTTGLPVLSDAPVVLWPDWLLKLCARAEHKSISPCAPAAGFISPHYPSRMRSIIARLLAARQGERNSLLYWSAVRFAEAMRVGAIQEDTAIAILRDAGIRVGLDAREISATVLSGFRTTSVGQS